MAIIIMHRLANWKKRPVASLATLSSMMTYVQQRSNLGHAPACISSTTGATPKWKSKLPLMSLV